MSPAWRGWWWGGLGGGGMRCQCEFRVCRIQMSLRRLEARNHSELERTLVHQVSVSSPDAMMFTHTLLLQQRCLFSIYAIGVATVTYICAKYLTCRKLYRNWKLFWFATYLNKDFVHITQLKESGFLFTHTHHASSPVSRTFKTHRASTQRLNARTSRHSQLCCYSTPTWDQWTSLTVSLMANR